MNLNHWVNGAWADSSWVPESWAEVAAEEAGIGLAPVVRAAPVDFVIQSPLWRQGFVTPRPAPQQTTEASELKEMMQLYAMWKRAA